MGDAKTNKPTEIITKKTKDQFDVADILKNDTRFMIHGFLSIYSELSLKELSELSNKPKNSLLDHLNIMVGGGIIEVSREERVRGKNTRKFYKLTSDADEKTRYFLKKTEDKYSAEYLSSNIETFIAFSQTKISMLSKWVQYLEGLKEKMVNGKIDEVKEIFKEIWKNKENFTSISYYSQKNALNFNNRCYKLYNELEEEAKNENIEESPDETLSGNIRKQTRPYYASMTMIPIERVLNALKKKPKVKKTRV